MSTSSWIFCIMLITEWGDLGVQETRDPPSYRIRDGMNLLNKMDICISSFSKPEQSWVSTSITTHFTQKPQWWEQQQYNVYKYISWGSLSTWLLKVQLGSIRPMSSTDMRFWPYLPEMKCFLWSTPHIQLKSSWWLHNNHVLVDTSYLKDDVVNW